MLNKEKSWISFAKLIFLTNLICILSVNLSNAQWVRTSYELGNMEIYSLAYSGTNLLAGTDGWGIFQTTNNGTNWNNICPSSERFFSLAVNGNHIYAGSYTSGVWLSTNNGLNWDVTSLMNDWVYSLVSNGNYTFAGTYGNGVFMTPNNGITWTQTSLNNRTVYSLAINGSFMFAGTYPNSGVYVSTNNGTTWSQTSLNNHNVSSLGANGNKVFAGTSGNGVYISLNNGLNWAQSSLNNQYVRAIAISGNNIIVGCDFSTGVFVSGNNGISWVQKNEGLSYYSSVYSLCILNNYIYAGTLGGVYRRQLNELVGINPISTQLPIHFSLDQNYPNPFNPSTKIRFSLPQTEISLRVVFTKLIVYDALGCEVQILVNEFLRPGIYEVDFDGSNLPSGVYYYRLETGSFTETKKMMLIK